jgi:hypothetical protein
MVLACQQLSSSVLSFALNIGSLICAIAVLSSLCYRQWSFALLFACLLVLDNDGPLLSPLTLFKQRLEIA